MKNRLEAFHFLHKGTQTRVEAHRLILVTFRWEITRECKALFLVVH